MGRVSLAGGETRVAGRKRLTRGGSVEDEVGEATHEHAFGHDGGAVAFEQDAGHREMVDGTEQRACEHLPVHAAELAEVHLALEIRGESFQDIAKTRALFVENRL